MFFFWGKYLYLTKQKPWGGFFFPFLKEIQGFLYPAVALLICSERAGIPFLYSTVQLAFFLTLCSTYLLTYIHQHSKVGKRDGKKKQKRPLLPCFEEKRLRGYVFRVFRRCA